MITLRKSFSNWIKISEDEAGNPVEFLIEYPDLKAQSKLDQIRFDAFEPGDKEAGTDAKMKGGKWIEYMREFVRYHVRDWRGIEDKFEKGANGFMTDELLLRLTFNEVQLNNIYQVIQEQVTFNATDKKKL